jgi:crossover junction endodeoxyribonuclease RuvC
MQSNKTVMGVDIGINGALSFYDGVELIIYDMPTFKVKGGNEYDANQIARIIKENKPSYAVIEKAMLMPSNGKKSYQSLGLCQGLFYGVLCCLDVPYEIISPMVWKKAMQCPKEKDASRMRASQLFPQFAHNWDRKKDDGRAESSLIALFGYNKNN